VAHRITAYFVCKDPEWAVTYVDDDDGTWQQIETKMFHDILVFEPRWTDPDQPMTPEQATQDDRVGQRRGIGAVGASDRDQKQAAGEGREIIRPSR
jgi:hypothetical protein